MVTVREEETEVGRQNDTTRDTIEYDGVPSNGFQCNDWGVMPCETQVVVEGSLRPDRKSRLGY